MAKRVFFLCLGLALASSCSFTGVREGRADFSRVERRVLRVPTAGLFDGGYFTVSSADMERDGWRLPVEDGVPFTPGFRHEPVGWYIMSPVAGNEVRAAMRGVVRLARRTELGKTVVVLHPNGLETVYAHHARTLVESGDCVSAGQAVALAGAGHGAVYTYFSLMADGVPVSPSALSRPDGVLKFDVAQFRADGAGRVRAFLFRKGEVAERPPLLDRFRARGAVDLDRPFSDMERRHVGAATPGLFAQSPSFTVDLSRIGRWCYPLPGARVISPYGGARKGHAGTDLKTRPGDKVRAAFDGVVRFSGKYSSYGNMVVVRHACGLETCYAHNSRNLVRAGDRVRAGDAIATVGRTGRATTEHCHFEVRVNGVPFDSDYVFDHDRRVLREGRLTFRREADGSISARRD